MNSKFLKFLRDKKIPLDTPLWRYMRLSAFFLLLRKNIVFIPSLEKLQLDDPKEMRIRQHSVRPNLDPFFKSPEFIQARDWLDKKYHSRFGGSVETTILNSYRMEEWLRQLKIRRCAWCWFAPPPKSLSQWMESMAMWSFYARDGVAIRTTLDHITAAIQETELKEMLVAKMLYRAQDVPDRCFDDSNYARRPFLFKSKSYEHEQEIRLMFRAKVPRDEPGLKISVDVKTLLDGGEVVISPYLLPEEADALIEVIKRLVPRVNVRLRHSAERSPGPADPRDKEREKEAGLRQFSKPFSEEDDLPNLLREL